LIFIFSVNDTNFSLQLKMERLEIPDSLIYINDSVPGYSRKEMREKFVYFDAEGNKLTDAETLSRISELVIPPDWRNVWICSDPMGHIQVTGRDSKGRKQYIYHTLWAEIFSQHKFDGLKTFGEKLPLIREQVKKDLRRRTWDKQKVTALAVSLMQEFYLRVGNKAYEQANKTYGLTTLRRKHLKEHKKNLFLQFKAKSGKLMHVKISHPVLKKQLRQCSELPGYELFRYKSINGYSPLTSSDINEYLRDISGINITSKDFRTWGGTVLTVKFEPIARGIVEENPRRKFETALVKLVANELNNTMAVCRKYYIHPGVLDVVVNGNSSRYKPGEDEIIPDGYRHAEMTVLNILNELAL
jgi:DNA topoisomerase I